MKAKSSKEFPNDDLSNAIRLQRNDPEFIRTVAAIQRSYYIFLGSNIQMSDIASMCGEFGSVLCVDTTFNLCPYWVTDCTYTNQRLITNSGNHPIFLGPSIIHFEKDEIIFRRFISEMCCFEPKIQEIKCIGTDLERAFFNGFSSQLPSLKLLLCVRHLHQNDKRKLTEMNAKNSAEILADIYGRHYGSIKEYGLADSKDSTDLSIRLRSLKEKWEELCPRFYEWFCKNRQSLFETGVIESARENTQINSLFYNNNVETEHFVEKKEQSFKKGDIKEVIDTMKALTERQQTHEVMALYGSGPFKLAKEFKKFQKDSVVWHSLSEKDRRRHVEKFRAYKPTLEDSFEKPKASGVKPCLLYTSPSPRDKRQSRMPSSA